MRRRRGLENVGRLEAREDWTYWERHAQNPSRLLRTFVPIMENGGHGP